MVVQHNLTAMNSNRMLGLTTKAQAKSTEKLSSGYKINRAADDAAGLAISEKMRRQIRGLTQASANAQDGISAVQTAEGALTEVHDMLQRMNELATKSANGTNSQEERDYIQSEVDALIAEIDRVSETTKFNEIYLLKGAATESAGGAAEETPATKQTVTLKQTTIDAMAGKLAIKDGADAAYAAGSTEAVTGASGATAEQPAKIKYEQQGTDKLFGTLNGWTDNAEITADNVDQYFDVDETTGELSIKTGAEFKVGANVGAGTAKDLDALKADGWVTGVAKQAAAGASEGTLKDYVEVAEDGSLKYKDGAMLYTAKGVDDTQFGAQLDAVKIDEGDLDDYFELKGDFIYTDDGGTTKLTEDTDLSAYFDEYGVYTTPLYKKNDDGTVTEIGAEQIYNYFDKTPAEGEGGAGAAGPALEFNLHVGAEGDEQNKITVKIEAMSAAGIGIDGLKSTEGVEHSGGVSSEDSATAAIETIKAAIKKVSQQRSDLGAVQNRLEHTINNLDNVVENTTAAESQIRDTDMATEMVRYANNNILAQAGQAMLAQANQGNQGVLSLLG